MYKGRMSGLYKSQGRSLGRRHRWLSPLRLLSITLAVQILCLLLWGLTWPGQTPVELSFIVPQDEVHPWQNVIADFEVEHPDIRITLVTDPEATYTTDQREAIYTADFQAEVAQYDLVYMDIVWIPKFAAQLINLMPLIERDGLDISDFLSTELTAGRRGDGLYRLPMRADLGVLYYRQDLLGQAGFSVPSTLAELAQVVTALKQQFSAVDFGYLWQGRSYEGLVTTFVEVMHSFGATWIDPANQQVGLDTAAAMQAAELLRDLLQQGISPPIVTDYTEQSSLEAFQQGQAVFLRGWPYFWTELKAQGWEDRVAIAPPFSFTPTPGVGCRGGWGFGIPRNAAHPDEAWEVIKYFTSEAAQAKFVSVSGFLPSRRSLFQNPDIVAQHPIMPQMLDYLEQSSVFRPSLKQYDAASEILQTALGKILRGQQSVEAAMQQAQRETEALIES
ncbi:MAG: ABC transporter substrate-binding protein [Leptolyngbya sp. SIO1E4]|nr:ABC transporter substrate-binding protein [Leptolyngbya sp. SIO1E4]